METNHEMLSMMRKWSWLPVKPPPSHTLYIGCGGVVGAGCRDGTPMPRHHGNYRKMIVVPLGRTRIKPVPEIHEYWLSAPLPGAPNVP